MMIPKPPAVKATGFKFPHVYYHQQRELFKRNLTELVISLRKQTPVPGYQEMFTRYLAVIEPTKVYDPARLPYQSVTPNDMRTGTKIACVYARLSWLILKFWQYCASGDDTEARMLATHIEEFMPIAKYGFEKCSLCGDVRHGYWLEGPDA
jgi:hypothetical protein